MLEKDLYAPVQDYLDVVFKERLKPIYGDFRHLSAITSNTGGANTGIWSKPDLCLIALRRAKYGLQWDLDLHGFEVKPEGKCTVQSVHEALNHSSLVHFTHLVWHCAQYDERDANCRAVADRCNSYGVGLVTLSSPSDLRTYAIRAAARRHAPEPDFVDGFLETRLAPSDRERLAGWIKELR